MFKVHSLVTGCGGYTERLAEYDVTEAEIRELFVTEGTEVTESGAGWFRTYRKTEEGFEENTVEWIG